MSYNQFMTQKAPSIVQAKEDQDLRDFRTIITKNESTRNSSAVFDIYDCNRLPLLKTRISTPATSSKAYELFVQNRDFGMPESAKLQSSSISQLGSTDIRSGFSGIYRALSIRQETSRVIKTANEKENENDKLARILQYMTDAKQIIDSSRLYYEAAVSFQELEMFERASYCYKKATKRASAALVVDTYDLPEDEKYRRRVERMSKFQLPQFMQQRRELRGSLIFAEEERQRLRARESHFQLARIHLLTDLVDLSLAHSNIRLAFRNCSNTNEHNDMLLSMHVIMKEFAGRKHREIPLSSQIQRGTQGPIADAHLNVLLELEALFPHSPDVHEWLGYRYTEKCDLEAAQFHFKKLRDLLEPVPDMQDTLLLWGGAFRTAAGTGDAGDPVQVAIEREIAANISKTPFGKITLLGEEPRPLELSDADRAINAVAAKLKARQDRAAGGGGTGAGNQRQGSAEDNSFVGNTTGKIRSSAQNNVPSFQALGIAQRQQQQKEVEQAAVEKPDLAWFGGVHTDCNTVLYKAPLQGWNTLLPSSAPARPKR